ncbi:NAC domain protein [Tripterygium wilfordii]|uniref:NAC domain protein n=1 Tax=Tripterygium wilfordii TaxID=458696 RepID=A0A7J7CA54_TRIWF|nr:NAC domain-containing protein 83-like [Tripterygium wilfordii]KAF5730980.1 NAC domain protein [Tripterygium wilfordii]
MDKFNSTRDGLTRLPPGFRFQPTDEELVFQYLKCKVFAWALPATIIPEINVCKYDPWDLPGDVEQEKYFFSNKEAKYRNGKRINRSTASGYWKATGSDKHIVSSVTNYQMMGIRKTLVFHRGKPPHGSRTDWIMHEYRLVAAPAAAASTANVACERLQTTQIEQLDNWVLCRIFLKIRSSSSKDDQQTQQSRDVNDFIADEPRFFNFMPIDKADDLSPASSSSSSSSNAIIDTFSSGSYH